MPEDEAQSRNGSWNWFSSSQILKPLGNIRQKASIPDHEKNLVSGVFNSSYYLLMLIDS
nr:hypothetical protein Iba_chr12cCG19020 [Ipomoea batatas]